MSDSSKKSRFIGILIIVTIIIVFGIFFIPDIFNGSHNNDSVPVDSTITNKRDTAKRIDTNFLKAIVSDEDTNERIIRVSEKSDLGVEYQIDDKAGKSVRRVFTGRRINIAVIGVDARLGTRSKRADANHVISILIDQGIVEITSLPRDTPVDIGMPDTSGQNKLTILYAKGQKGYFEEVARMAGLDRIHYYVELGFSQAMGIIELLGFKDPHSTLQVLRSRKGLGGDDYQRCYNQGQFIRQMLLKHFGKLTGFFGDILLRGGLALINTNITYDKAKDIINKLNNKGFPKNDTSVTVKVRPPIMLNYKVYDFSNQEIITQLEKRIERFNENNGEIDTTTGEVVHTSYKVAPRLWNAIKQSIKDTARNSLRVIGNLRTYFDQRAWLQVREKIREQICILLMSAYTKMKKPTQADEVRALIDAEKKVFSVPLQ